MKKITLALWAVGTSLTHADASTELPWATGKPFSAEIALGTTTMGSPSGADNESSVPPTVQAIYGTQHPTVTVGGGGGGAITMDLAGPSYWVNWSQMQSSPRYYGFAGQMNLHYMMAKGIFAGGLYAGVGYNGARSSSTIDPFLENSTWTLNDNTSTIAEPVATHNLTGSFVQRDGDDASDLQAKATVSSGLMFQAGTRFGAIIGNVFPHLRVGWAAYQLNARMTNQYEATEGTSFNGAMTSQHTWKSDGTFINTSAIDMTMQVNALPSSERITLSSTGNRWTNAITLGGGLDWAFKKKMTLGIYYQVALCQRIIFKKWNKNAINTWSAVVQNQTGGDIPFNQTAKVAHQTYVDGVPMVSISPVIQTMMFSAKYAFGKA